MLNFCPLCVAEVYALRCDAVFLYLQNLYLSTSKRCIKMGIPSLNSAIFYCVRLYFSLLSYRESSRHLILHEEDLHEVVQIAIENTLGV